MDCRTYRRHHLEFEEHALPEGLAAALREHTDVCARCLRLTVALRRGLMVARSTPALVPSAGFRARLAARLAAQFAVRLSVPVADGGARTRTVYLADGSIGDSRAQDRAGARHLRPRVSLSR